MIDTVEKVTGKKIKASEVGRRPGDPPVLVGSALKARKLLGWQPRFNDLSLIIDTAWRWQQKI